MKEVISEEEKDSNSPPTPVVTRGRSKSCGRSSQRSTDSHPGKKLKEMTNRERVGISGSSLPHSHASSGLVQQAHLVVFLSLPLILSWKN